MMKDIYFMLILGKSFFQGEEDGQPEPLYTVQQ